MRFEPFVENITSPLGRPFPAPSIRSTAPFVPAAAKPSNAVRIPSTACNEYCNSWAVRGRRKPSSSALDPDNAACQTLSKASRAKALTARAHPSNGRMVSASGTMRRIRDANASEIAVTPGPPSSKILTGTVASSRPSGTAREPSASNLCQHLVMSGAVCKPGCEKSCRFRAARCSALEKRACASAPSTETDHPKIRLSLGDP